jgi:hypothetical protein
MIVNRSGRGSSTFRATLPSEWIRKMGLDEGERGLILEFNGESIKINKEIKKKQIIN